MTTKQDAQTILDAGAASSLPAYVGGRPYVALPDGYTLHDIEHMLPFPTRRKGRVEMLDVRSFVSHIKKQPDKPTIYARKLPSPRFIAVFNDHDHVTAGWQDHRAEYSCPFSVEWNTWAKRDGYAMTQADFARFIEDNLVDVVQPSGADMLEISRTLEAKKKVDFASGIRLSNGQQELVYEETISGTAAKGKIQIPEVFFLGIPVFEGGPAYKVEARLRYRIREADKKLEMSYDLLRAHKIIDSAFQEVWQEIEIGTGINILNGQLL